MNITITEQTARVCLDLLADWLEYFEGLDKQTRQRVIALDELTRELEADDYLEQKQAEQEAARIRMMEEHRARMEANEKAAK